MEKKSLLCYLPDILILIGWFVPYIFGFGVYQWMWGLAASGGVVIMLPLVGTIMTMFMLAILILILVIVNILLCFLMGKRENKKIFGIIKLVLGVLILIFVILPVIIQASIAPYIYIGFYLMLIGAIIKIIFGLLVFMEKL